MVEILTQKQLEIFKVFRSNIFKKYTYQECKKLLNENSNNFLINTFKKLIKLDLVNVEKINNLKLYGLNLENSLVFAYLEIINSDFYKSDILKNVIKEIKIEVDEIISFYSIVVFGSYAIDKEEKDSDLDIAIFVEDNSKKKDIESIFERIKLKTVIELDLHLITKDEFLKMLKEKKVNLGHLLFGKHKCIYNTNLFYKILIEGHKNGISCFR